MPPDTTYIPGVTGPPPPTGDPFVDSLVQSQGDGNDPAKEQGKSTGLNGGDIFLMLIFGIVMVILSKGAGMVPGFIRRKWRAARINKLVSAKGAVYHNLLLSYNPYYRSLPGEARSRFLQRTVHFADEKEFRFHSMEEEEHIPVLISGAAVQLTFGLRNYLMDYFDVIHVMRKEYVLNIDKETYYGHVSRSGIHISWNRFREGYGDYTDSLNVGLHEMAHALQFDVYLGLEDHHDRGFKYRLSDFSEEGRPVFRAMRKGMSHLLDDYAMTNFDEFWAVSVETFFENPEEFRDKLPALYREMCQLLNQDPLFPGNVINPGIG